MKKVFSFLCLLIAVTGAALLTGCILFPAFLTPVSNLVGGTKMLSLISAGLFGLGIAGYVKLGGKLSLRRTPAIVNASPYGSSPNIPFNANTGQSMSLVEVRAAGKVNKEQTRQQTKALIDIGKANNMIKPIAKLGLVFGIGKKKQAAKVAKALA